MRAAVCASLVAALLPAGIALAAPVDTTVRTIGDTDGDNRLEFAPGEPHVVVGAQPDFRPPRDGSILNFLQLSDFQIVDEESPGRVEFFDTTQRGPFNPFSAAYRPQESLTTQATEAMVRQARNTVSPVTGEPLDLAILTGDNADSQQFNETRWFIDVLDGHTFVEPDSGVPAPGCEATPGTRYDGVRNGANPGYYEPDRSSGADGDGYSPDRNENRAETGRDVTVRDFPTLFEAAQARFRAIGLDMPWYSAFGNHDALVQGNSPEAYFGPAGASGEASNPSFQGTATGCEKPGVGQVPPDPRRCYLAKDEPMVAPAPCATGGWIQQHFLTGGTPVGHGFANRPTEARMNHDGYYSFSPRAGLRFVVLDTVTDECGSEFCSEGSVDDTQFRWLEREIAEATRAGEYVLVFSHHTLRTTRFPSTDPTEQPIHFGERLPHDDPQPRNPAGAESLEELYCRSPNVLAHVAGHEHENYVRHHTCAADVPPVPGGSDFWHMSTAAHIDFPQQSRMIELVDNENGTMSLVLTMLDHAGEPDPGGAPADAAAARGDAGEQVLRLASIARELAYNDYQGSRAARGSREDRNVIVVLDRPWPPVP